MNRLPTLVIHTRPQPPASPPTTLLAGKPYTSSAETNVLATFRRFGWVPPSEQRRAHHG
jgi:hypothetical protein